MRALRCDNTRRRINRKNRKVRLLVLIPDVPGETQAEREEERLKEVLQGVEGVLEISTEFPEIFVAIEPKQARSVRRAVARAERDIREAFKEV